MSNFVKDYILKMRTSDEKTKHRSALTISIIFSIIILSLFFGFFGRYIFDFQNTNKNQESSSAFTELSSSFSKFWSDSNNQVSNIKTNINQIYSFMSRASSTASSTIDNTNISSTTSSSSLEATDTIDKNLESTSTNIGSISSKTLEKR